MVLNIFPRREKPTAQPAPELERTLPEPSVEALDGDGAKKTTRRGTRGGRGRRKPAAELAEATSESPEAAETPEPEPAAPKAPAARRSRAPKAAAPVEAEPEPVPAPEVTAAPAPRRSAARKAEPASSASQADLSALIKVVEAQGKQLEQIARAQEELVRRAPGAPGAALARVGVFVDAANVELAIDRLRTRVDWRKVLNLISEGRSIVRAIAYSPVHDDPGVSIETQRFAEPFLGKGYKVVTKPLKRFADGTIKANVDIEMACDIIEMLDRLDVVCLVSGDGDFQRLVEVIQAKGIRVEVLAVGSSTAASLRNAADQFVDLQGIIQKVKA